MSTTLTDVRCVAVPVSDQDAALRDDLDGLVTYDDRLAAAARRNGVPVVTPR